MDSEHAPSTLLGLMHSPGWSQAQARDPLPPPPECWDPKCSPPHPASFGISAGVFMRGLDTLSHRVCSWILPGTIVLFLRTDLCLRGLSTEHLILIIFLAEGLCVHARLCIGSCVHACEGQRTILGVTPQELTTLGFLFCLLVFS